VANGAKLDAYEEVADPPREWNHAYFDLLAHCLPELALPEIEQLALAPISSLPDEPSFDVIAQFLRSVDAVYFNDGGLQESIAIGIRSALATRLMASSGWKRLGGSRSASIEIHIGPAIAVLFFNDYGFAQPSKCYLLSKGVDRLDSFLPVLEKLVQSGPSLFVAVVTLNLLEVSPKSAHLPFLIAAAKRVFENCILNAVQLNIINKRIQKHKFGCSHSLPPPLTSLARGSMRHCEPIPRAKLADTDAPE
jgi:hypothetical protein